MVFKKQFNDAEIVASVMDTSRKSKPYPQRKFRCIDRVGVNYEVSTSFSKLGQVIYAMSLLLFRVQTGHGAVGEGPTAERGALRWRGTSSDDGPLARIRGCRCGVAEV